MSGNSYSTLISRRLVEERKQDERQLEKAEANRIARRKAFQQAANWLEGALIAELDAAVTASGGGISIDYQNDLAADGQDAYKNPQVAFSIGAGAGTARDHYEVFVAHGLITMNRISNHLRQPIVTPGFSGPQLVVMAGQELAKAMVRRAVDDSLSRAGG